MAVGLVSGASLAGNAYGIEQGDQLTYSRRVEFELTFAHRDLVWLGDPASPTALAYLKPGVRPIATDVCVTTVTRAPEAPKRRYFDDCRIVAAGGARKVYAFTRRREKHIGAIDPMGRFVPNDFYEHNRALLPSWPRDAASLAFDQKSNRLYADLDVAGPLVSESLDFLPLQLSSPGGEELVGRYEIGYQPSRDAGPDGQFGIVTLTFQHGGSSVVLARTAVPAVFRRDDMQLQSYNMETGQYLTEAAYRAGAPSDETIHPSVTVAIPGAFAAAVRADGASLVLVDETDAADVAAANGQVSPPQIAIDGNFDDWRNTAGLDDPQGDLVPYLEYIPDVDLLELKVSHDNGHIYLYARVAGKIGRSHPDGGRAYFYAYMDVDQDAGTGFLPTRDDECYYGVDLGDDCEVQFEFVNNALRKTFYGFCGLGGNNNVLKQQVSLGRSQYGRFDAQGVERANYKAEYTFRDGVTEITEDLKLGTSDTIRVAVSPDGSEVEVSSTFTGFLKNPDGQPTVQLGQTIDLAVGMECDSKAYPGKSAWAADSTPVMRGYHLSPQATRIDR